MLGVHLNQDRVNRVNYPSSQILSKCKPTQSFECFSCLTIEKNRNPSIVGATRFTYLLRRFHIQRVLRHRLSGRDVIHASLRLRHVDSTE